MEKEKQTKKKFNIVDVVVLLVLAAAIVFFAYKVLTREEDTGSSVSRLGTAYFTVEVDGIRRELYDEVAAQLPAQMLAGTKLVNGRIVSISCEPCTVVMLESTNPTISASTNYVLPSEDVEYVNALLVCEAEVELDTPNNASMSQELRLGRPYYVKSKMIELVGTVISLELSE